MMPLQLDVSALTHCTCDLGESRMTSGIEVGLSSTRAHSLLSLLSHLSLLFLFSNLSLASRLSLFSLSPLSLSPLPLFSSLSSILSLFCTRSPSTGAPGGGGREEERVGEGARKRGGVPRCLSPLDCLVRDLGETGRGLLLGGARGRAMRPCKVGRSGEIWGDLGRSGETLPGAYTTATAPRVGGARCHRARDIIQRDGA